MSESFHINIIIMFHKEGSFRGGSGSKKAKDTPIKKSERRKLRSACLSFLASTTPATSTESQHETNDKSLLDSILDSTFLDNKADILIRKIKQPNAKSNAGATVINIRTPSPSSPVAPASADADGITQWPYSKKDQPILIQMPTTTISTRSFSFTYWFRMSLHSGNVRKPVPFRSSLLACTALTKSWSSRKSVAI